MGGEMQEKDEIELSLEELYQVSYDTIKINNVLNAMRNALADGCYASAYLYSERLKSLGNIRHGFCHYFSHYEDEIYECALICAENGEIHSIISLMKKYTAQQGFIDPRAFYWCKKLYQVGYIPSIRWVAECYEKGIGCEIDVKAAFQYYFEGMLLEGDEFCRLKFIEYFHEYNKSEYLEELMERNVFFENIRLLRGDWKFDYGE